VKVVTAIQPAAATDVEMLIEWLEDLKDPSNPSYKDACDLCEASAARLSERLGESDVKVSREVLVGPAAQAIVELAEEWRPDLIVIGSHGRGFWKRMWLGSVADRVTRHAPCSVLIVRKPA
jgi:nucleotide-binding universal stress UspA family protein